MVFPGSATAKINAAAIVDNSKGSTINHQGGGLVQIKNLLDPPQKNSFKRGPPVAIFSPEHTKCLVGKQKKQDGNTVDPL